MVAVKMLQFTNIKTQGNNETKGNKTPLSRKKSMIPHIKHFDIM